MATAAAASKPAPPAVVDVKTFGARCDGATNDTAAVQAAADAAAGKTLVFPVGTCMVSGIRVADTTVTGAGPTSVVKLRPAALGDDKPVFEAGNNVTIQNVTVDGNRAAQPGHRVSDSYNDAGANYRDSCFSCGAGRGYQAGVRGEAITRLTVRNTVITATFGAAVATNNSSRVTISDNNIYDTNFEAAYIYGSTAPYRNVSGGGITISDNQMANVGRGTGCSPACAEANAIVLSRVNTATVSGNTLDGVDRDLVKVESSQNVVIDQNSAVNGRVQYPGIQIQAVHDLPSVNISITNNTISGPGFLAGVQINSSSVLPSMAKKITVSGNTIRNVTYGVLTDGDVGLDTIRVNGNIFRNITSSAIYQNGGGTNLTFQNNRVDGRRLPNVTR